METKMKNSYAKEYYNSFLKDLPDEYMQSRWFSSPESKLDYFQTRRSLVHVLASSNFKNTLEIGPGDGVWTDLIIKRTDKLTLLDQSVEMINRAKERLSAYSEVSYVVQDFLEYSSTEKHDLIFAIRCFEYFEDKDKALAQFARLLQSGGKLIVVTKNPEHAKMNRVQERSLHKGQVSKKEMIALLESNGFVVTSVMSATWRFKAKYAPMRFIFNTLQKMHVATNGAFVIPYVTNRLTESYTYEAVKK